MRARFAESFLSRGFLGITHHTNAATMQSAMPASSSINHIRRLQCYTLRMLTRNAMAIVLFALAVFLSAAAPPSAVAAEECPKIQMGEEGRRKGAELADLARAYLQTNGAKVALLGRAGSDAPEKRFAQKIGVWNYTHAGLAFRDHPDGEWTFVHLLNTCGEQSGVFAETFLQFFMDNPHEYRAVVAVPSAPMQNALEELLVQGNAAAYRNDSVYSSISYPFSLARQNSNEYVLDVFAAALAKMEDADAPSRETAKAYFLSSPHRDKFSPEIIQIGFWERFGVSLGFGPDNATLDDHTPAERAAGRYQFVSVGALINFLDALGMLQSTQEFALANIAKAKDTVVEE